MEPQEECYYDRKHGDKKDCKCLRIVMCIIFALFLGTLGLILGAIFARVLIFNIAVLISFAVMLVILFILTIIYKICACSKNKKH